MRRRAVHNLVLFLSAAWLTVSPARAGDILDRVVATVNNHAILQSDWEDELRYEAFISGAGSQGPTLEGQKAALDRLIDQELLGEQLRLAQTQGPSQDEVSQRLAGVREQYPGAENDEVWRALQRKFGVTESGLRSRLALQLSLSRLVDLRLRPAINIDSKSIESYYNQELLPQLRQAGAKAVALEDVKPQIREVLTEQKLSQMLVAWLQTLRAGSSIRGEAIDDPANILPK
jgi:hypothetical protein